MLDPEVESRPWAEQLALDDASYREQLAYLFARSAFYREKLAAAGIRLRSRRRRARRHRAAAAHREARAQGDLHPPTTPSARISARTPAEIVRIYSTSGTTGAPSYIPLTAQDLDNWVTGSARSYAASGVAPGAADRLHLQRRAVRGRSGARRVRQGRPLPHPGRHRQHRAPDAGDRAPEARSGSAHAVLCRLSHRVGGRAATWISGDRASKRVLVAGEPGGGEPAFRARLEEGWGAKVTEAMGIGDIGPSLWGECEEQDGMHLGARGFVHAELIDPDSGVALAAGRRRHAASSC